MRPHGIMYTFQTFAGYRTTAALQAADLSTARPHFALCSKYALE